MPMSGDNNPKPNEQCILAEEYEYEKTIPGTIRKMLYQVFGIFKKIPQR